MKALVGAFTQEKALVGAFSVIVQPAVEPMDRFAALHFTPTMAALEISSSTSSSSGGGGKYHLTSLAEAAPSQHISNSLSAAVTGDTRGQI